MLDQKRIQGVLFQASAFLFDMFPRLNPKIMKFARDEGILREGTHYIKPNASKPIYYMYCIPRVISLVVEILRCHKASRHKSFIYRKKGYIRVPKRDIVAVSTPKKRKISEAIVQAYQIERGLWAKIDNLQKTRLKLEQEYWTYLWHRKECPHCRGTGYTITDDPCIMCKGPTIGEISNEESVPD